MLISDECLDLDGDAVASGRGRRYARKQLLTAPGEGGAVCGRMPMLSDEQSDESLLWHPRTTPAPMDVSLLLRPARVHGQERTSCLDKTTARVSMIWS
jgi:hypothetical protein